MDLVITLKKEQRDAMFLKVCLAIASESYSELQNSYGFLMRQHNLLNPKKATALINAIDKIKEDELIPISLDKALLLVTAMDITLKIMRSKDPFRFFHAFQNDKKKRLAFRLELITFCNEMMVEIAEQAIFRGEIDEHKEMLKEFTND